MRCGKTLRGLKSGIWWRCLQDAWRRIWSGLWVCVCVGGGRGDASWTLRRRDLPCHAKCTEAKILTEARGSWRAGIRSVAFMLGTFGQVSVAFGSECSARIRANNRRACSVSSWIVHLVQKRVVLGNERIACVLVSFADGLLNSTFWFHKLGSHWVMLSGCFTRAASPMLRAGLKLR